MKSRWSRRPCPASQGVPVRAPVGGPLGPGRFHRDVIDHNDDANERWYNGAWYPW